MVRTVQDYIEARSAVPLLVKLHNKIVYSDHYGTPGAVLHKEYCTRYCIGSRKSTTPLLEELYNTIPKNYHRTTQVRSQHHF